MLLHIRCAILNRKIKKDDKALKGFDNFSIDRDGFESLRNLRDDLEEHRKMLRSKLSKVEGAILYNRTERAVKCAKQILNR